MTSDDNVLVAASRSDHPHQTVCMAAALDQSAEHLVGFDRDFRKRLPRARFTPLKA